MSAQRQTSKLDAADGQLVDLVATALVDPNLHADARMHLASELAALVDDAQTDLHVTAIHQAQRPPQDGGLATILAALLVDPNLHTDLRMRLHEQIPKLIAAARQDASAHA